MNQWRKSIASWHIGKTLYLSVPFTWLLPDALRMAKAHKGAVMAGGPAVDLRPDYLAGVTEMPGECPGGIRPLAFHNPLATFTSRGCVNSCGFCAVPKIEGELRELNDWPVRPVVCDNNLLATSRAHFDRVIDRLKVLPYVDFNQGLDARRFNPHHARRLAELRGVKIRFAFDHIGLETQVVGAIQLAQSHGLKDIGCYCLIGFNDTPEDAIYRLDKIREWGALPNPMRYQPLGALEKNSYLGRAWTEAEIARITRYYSRLNWLGHIPFAEYKRNPTLPLWTGGPQ